MQYGRCIHIAMFSSDQRNVDACLQCLFQCMSLWCGVWYKLCITSEWFEIWVNLQNNLEDWVSISYLSLSYWAPQSLTFPPGCFFLQRWHPCPADFHIFYFPPCYFHFVMIFIFIFVFICTNVCVSVCICGFVCVYACVCVFLCFDSLFSDNLFFGGALFRVHF